MSEGTEKVRPKHAATATKRPKPMSGRPGFTIRVSRRGLHIERVRPDPKQSE